MKKPTRGTNERTKMIKARKTLEKRDRVLTAAIRRCHVELAKRKSLRDIEASKDEVEAAWKEFNQANSRYCVSAGWVAYRKEEQPEEVRRASYEWKVLTDMMEQVVEKAEEYLESATRENCCDDEPGPLKCFCASPHQIFARSASQNARNRNKADFTTKVCKLRIN